jgi:outer membrane protein assembly factor BamB
MSPSRTFLPAAAFSLLLAASPTRGDDWPQWRGPFRDGVWREDRIVEKLPSELSIKWRTEIGAGYSGPAVAAGRVYVTDRILEAGEENPEDPFQRRRVKGFERLLSLDAENGNLLWKHQYPCQYEIQYPSGPRATPTVHQGVVYSLGAMGDLFALDAVSGEVLWSKRFVEDFGTEINVWGMSAAPLVDGERLIVLAGGRPRGCVVALERKTGAELWRALEADDPGYCPPLIIEPPGRRELVIWTPRELASLDPASGEEHWRQPFRIEAGLSVATPIYDAGANRLLVSAFYNGSMMMQLERDKAAATLLWKGTSNSEKNTDGLHAILCTPALLDGYLYGVCSYGQLRCLDAASGKRVWETLEATGSGRWWNAFLVRHGKRFFIANEQGELIIARLTPAGYEEVSRALLIEPTQPIQRRKVVWSHPAFALRSVFARNDREILRADLEAR